MVGAALRNMVLAAQNGQKGVKMTTIEKCNVILESEEVLENCVVTATYNKLFVDTPDDDPVELDPVEVKAIQLVEGSEVITETSDESADPVEDKEV